jgi:RNA polymerase sigma-70 factor, ECF subfamily
MMTVPLEMSEALAAQTRVPAFEALYREHFDFVWRVLRGMGVLEANLEDAAQDVFMIVLRRLPEFDGRASPRTWLFEIALRVASNHRRTVRRKGEHGALDEQMPHGGPTPAEAADSRRALAQVLDVMDALDEELRVVLVLSELEGMTAAEVSELTGTNPNTVSSRLRRARAAFRAELERRTGSQP